MAKQSIEQKYNLQRLLARLLPGDRVDGPQYYGVDGVSDRVLHEALCERLIKPHSTHQNRYAITKRGYEALKTGYFESYLIVNNQVAMTG